MNLNQLEYFIAVAETLNFTKAAERSFITQTAISQQIRSLEDTVGVKLLERDKHHVRLTAAGETYLREARAIVEHSNDAIRLARSVSEGVSGSLCIGFIRGYVYEGIADLIRDYHTLYPNVNISFYRDNMNGLYSALESGRCDLIFNLAPSIGKDYPAGISSKYVSSYPLVVAMPQGHRFSDRKSLKYPELEGEDFIIMQPSARPKDDAEEVLVAYERGGFIPNIVASEAEPETLLLMVSAGMGISVLPEYIVRNHTLGRSLKVVPIVRADESPEMLETDICWRSESVNPAAGRFFEMTEQMHMRLADGI